MQSAMVSNRFIILGIVAFGVCFGLSLVFTWDFSKAFLIGIINVIALYIAALLIDRRRRNYEMLVLDSLHKRIKELEGLKYRIVAEINQLEAHRGLLYSESNQLQNQVSERRNQRDILNRELSIFVGQKKQIEAEINCLQTEIQNLDKSKIELNNSFSTLNAEKRRLELNYNVSRAEITKLQTQIGELQQEKQELESNLTLLERLKPQLEEKLYEMRVKVQELELQETEQNESLLAKKTEKSNIEISINSLENQIAEQQTELKQLQGQVSLLQEERDLLQSQVWEILQQMETLNPEQEHETAYHEDNIELFPFNDLLEPLQPIEAKNTSNSTDTTENLPEEWMNFLEQLPGYQIQVLKAIAEQDNANAAIKQIAEQHITMPNLLIDSINERANDTIGELIIDPGSEPPKIYHEHMINIHKMMAIYEYIMARQTSSN
ncbi:MAG: tellurite resistance TerB C-terminal domain-containing protein [Heteroscytonema crispum UTEX LB 1556]